MHRTIGRRAYWGSKWTSGRPCQGWHGKLISTVGIAPDMYSAAYYSGWVYDFWKNN